MFHEENRLFLKLSETIALKNKKVYKLQTIKEG